MVVLCVGFQYTKSSGQRWETLFFCLPVFPASALGSQLYLSSANAEWGVLRFSFVMYTHGGVHSCWWYVGICRGHMGCVSTILHRRLACMLLCFQLFPCKWRSFSLYCCVKPHFYWKYKGNTFAFWGEMLCKQGLELANENTIPNEKYQKDTLTGRKKTWLSL